MKRENNMRAPSVLSRFVRRTLAVPAVVPGYVHFVRSVRSRQIAIVAHHGVTDQRLEVPYACHVDVVEFARQMDFLVEHYSVLHLSEVVDRLASGKPLPPNTACLTFDDGFRNVATTAFPILRERQIPATVFLVTGFMETRQPAWPDYLYHCLVYTPLQRLEFSGREYVLERSGDRGKAYQELLRLLKQLEVQEREEALSSLFNVLGNSEVPEHSVVASMTWDEVEDLSRSGLVEFGSHTHTHPILSRCTEAEERRELQVSHSILRERGLSAHLFAYPNGTARDFTPRTEQMLREIGYHCAVSMLPGLNHRDADLFALRRIGVGSDTTTWQFGSRMAGL